VYISVTKMLTTLSGLAVDRPHERLRAKIVISLRVPYSILPHDFGLVRVGIASQQLCFCGCLNRVARQS